MSTSALSQKPEFVGTTRCCTHGASLHPAFFPREAQHHASQLPTRPHNCSLISDNNTSKPLCRYPGVSGFTGWKWPNVKIVEVCFWADKSVGNFILALLLGDENHLCCICLHFMIIISIPLCCSARDLIQSFSCLLAIQNGVKKIAFFFGNCNNINNFWNYFLFEIKTIVKLQ